MTARMPKVQEGLAEVIEAAGRLAANGQVTQAIARYQRWIDQDRTDLRKVGWFNMAVLQASAQQHDKARASYEAALAVDTHFHQARLNLGALLERMGLFEEALSVWEVTAQASPGPLPWEEDWALRAMNQMGRVLEQQKHLARAEAVLHRSLLRDPRQPDVLQHYLHLRQKQLEWPITAPVPGITSNDMLMGMSPLSMLAYADDPALQLLAARNFVARKLVHPEGPRPRRHAHQRLRIGYLSGDLCTHAVGLMLGEVLEAHDRSRFETFAFDYSPQDGTAHRARLLRAFEHVYPVSALSDADLASLIASCEIDVLVDMHGLSSGLRSGVLAARPAPVQVTYLGFIGTTAMPWIDYVIGDEFALPDALAPYFSEQFLRLRTCFLPVDRRRYESVPAIDRASEGLPEDAVVFGVFNNSYKITRPMVDLWVQILQQVPSGVLWLVDDNPEATRQLRSYLAGQGVDPARLIFSPRASTERYQSRLRLVDLFLDCFPYNAGSTARDVVHMGTPLLTMPGRTFVSRMAGSLLHHLGLDELIVQDPAAYVERAVALGRDPERLAGLRKRLREVVSAQGGGEVFMREFERVLLEAHHGTAAPVPFLEPGAMPVATARQALQQPAAVVPSAGPSERVRPYLLADTQAAFESATAPWHRLDCRHNVRPDWQGYWQIREFLRNEPMEEGAFYGFFPPAFTGSTGLDAQNLINAAAPWLGQADVVLASPQADMGAFFLNLFEQREVFDPGFMAAAQRFCELAGLEIDLRGALMDSRHVVFGNCFLATPAFWRRWLSLCEVLFGLCEDQPQLARDAGFLAPSGGPGAPERKVFLIERVASLLLVIEPTWKSISLNSFRFSYSNSRLSEFGDEAVISDALKMALSIQRYDDYLVQFSKVRDRLRN